MYCSLSPLEDAASRKIFFTRIEGAPFIGAGTVFSFVLILKQNGDEKIRYFHLIPKTEFYQLTLRKNCYILKVFFGLKDKLVESEPKK